MTTLLVLWLVAQAATAIVGLVVVYHIAREVSR